MTGATRKKSMCKHFMCLLCSLVTRKTVRGTGAIKRGFMQLKWGRFLLQGPPFPIRGASVPPMGGLFNCLIVGHGPGFNCIGPRGASGNFVISNHLHSAT